MLFLILYAVLFWIFAILSTLLFSVRENGLAFQQEHILKLPKRLVTALKALPALTAVIYVMLFRPTPAPFYLLLAIAFIFCILGDIGMEIKLLIGVGFFLIAQLLFTGTFIYQSVILGLSFLPLAAFFIAFIFMLIYLIFLYEYLQTSGPEPGKLRVPLIIYFIILSLTLCTSLLLWVTTGSPLGIIPLIGAIMFVISDSFIGVREFHHRPSKAELKILGTYYLAIFLLSLNAFIYMF